MMDVRTRRQDDGVAVLDLVRRAFSSDGRDGSEEVDIVKDVWCANAAPEGFDLVAVEQGRVTGHVLGSTGRVDGHRTGVGLAPLAVAPEYQRRGTGSALVRELLRRCDAAGVPFVVLLGDPKYYARFGFEAASPHGIVYEPVGATSPYFQINRLAAFDPGVAGTFSYSWEV
jgi:putative acetyltransferase